MRGSSGPSSLFNSKWNFHGKEVRLEQTDKYSGVVQAQMHSRSGSAVRERERYLICTLTCGRKTEAPSVSLPFLQSLFAAKS